MSDLMWFFSESNWFSWLMCGLYFGFAIGYDYANRKHGGKED